MSIKKVYKLALRIILCYANSIVTDLWDMWLFCVFVCMCVRFYVFVCPYSSLVSEESLCLASLGRFSMKISMAA